MEKDKFREKENFSFEDLKALVSFLRSPEGCPWDREQSHKSIRNHFVEEAYEVCEGIDKEDNALLQEELGDMLFQVLFHINLAEEKGAFTLEDVLNGICRKMIFRHPFLFEPGSEKPKDQIAQWEEMKKKEKGEESAYDTLSRISTALPSLKRAEKFIKKGASNKGIDPGEDPMLLSGETLYKIAEKCQKENIDPEQALNEYLSKILDKVYKL